MSNEIVPFGKHKGKPVEALLDDRPYLDWLLSQPWFKEKFGNVYNIIINAGQEPTETPEHNAMQIRFLDVGFRTKLVYLLGFGNRQRPIDPSDPEFETDGIDVLFDAFRTHRTLFSRSLICVEIKPSVGDDYPSVFRQIQRYKQIPHWPNDRSSVSKRYGESVFVLLTRSYTGVGVTREQFIQFFESQSVKVVFEADIDAVQLPLDSKNA